MARYDRGYDDRWGYRRPGWNDGLGRSGGRGYQGGRGDRPWGAGYRRGYQGGSGRMPPSGPGSYGLDSYDRDYWWLGEHELRRRGRLGPYDEAYVRFDRESHPRYSPVGGMYGAMGGRYAYHRPPRPLREDTWFSDWTHWF